jgi:hypothetical protein
MIQIISISIFKFLANRLGFLLGFGSENFFFKKRPKEDAGISRKTRERGPLLTVETTGRQLPALSSVLYRIISERRSVLAAKRAISLACLLVQ